MDVFSLGDAAVDDYRSFATSFTTIHAEDIRRGDSLALDEHQEQAIAQAGVGQSFVVTTATGAEAGPGTGRHAVLRRPESA